MAIVREVVGYPGYMASRDGRVWGRRGHELSVWTNNSGYRSVKAGRRHCAVHRCVALAWLPNPDGLTDVNHIDGDKTNNNVQNLEWCSRSENLRHALDNGLHACPETPVYGYNEEKNLAVWARSQAEVRAFGFHQSLVNKCLKRERRHHRGFVWSYA